VLPSAKAWRAAKARAKKAAARAARGGEDGHADADEEEEQEQEDEEQWEEDGEFHEEEKNFDEDDNTADEGDDVALFGAASLDKQLADVVETFVWDHREANWQHGPWDMKDVRDIVVNFLGWDVWTQNADRVAELARHYSHQYCPPVSDSVLTDVVEAFVWDRRAEDWTMNDVHERVERELGWPASVNNTDRVVELARYYDRRYCPI